MLAVFYGSDRTSVVNQAHKATNLAKTEVVTIEARDFISGQFTEWAASESLFSEALTYLIDTPSSQADFETECLEALADLAASPHQFYVLEGPLLAAVKKQYSKHADTIEEFSATKAERFNVFALADALCRKDKKTMWMILAEARLLGLPDEELIGILWWQLKLLRLAGLTNSAEEAGVKSYPYQKAKRALVAFSEDDILRLSNSLLRLYHDGHKGKVDLALSLERWVLKL
jgi:DNA polymerase III delta subunit